MAGVPGKSVPTFNSKEIPRFAPNFSVYLVPPDTVCLYSEDRKFLLHGQLFCDLAGAIAEGKKSFRDLVRTLERTYPTEAVEQAIKRLIDSRYIVSEQFENEAVAGFWASLGVAPDVAEQNLQKCRVRIQSIDVEGGAELAEALTELGVRLVKRGGDLTVTLVNDYLEKRLADLNDEHLADRSPWLLVQPSGLFPLVGPVFSPGKSACWTCLSERMKRNREIKALLDRREARCLVASPLVRHSVGQSGIQLAALEIAKAIATDFRTELSDHMLSLDLLGSTIVKHYVSARPQCPSCGQKKLSDPRRPPVPFEIGAGGKVVMTSGGYRSVPSAATVARFRRHVSPLVGVISRLERIQADLPLNTNFRATHNFAGPSETFHELRSGLLAGSFGKGSTAEQGEASALMEAMERYSGIFQGDEIRRTRRFADFAPGEAIPPNDMLLFSEAQLQQSQSPEGGTSEFYATPALFDPNAKIDWSPVWSLRDAQFRYLPTSALYFFYRGSVSFAADSNGCAAGNTREEAIVQGFLELVERDAYGIWWYNQTPRPEVDLSQFDDSYIRAMRTQFAEMGRRFWVLDVTNDLGIPTYVAISHWMEDGNENIEFGSGAHFDPRIALLRSLTEVNQFMSLSNARQTSSLDGTNPVRIKDHPYLLPSGHPKVEPDLTSKFGGLDTRQQVMACVDLIKKAGMDFLVLDQTRPDIEVPVVRVIVPGMRHFYRRFAPGRLYDVPVKLRWRDEPVREDELNPIHPHT